MTKSIFLKRFSATLQFILGFLLGISAIAGISGAVIFVYYAKMSTLPKKPVFPAVTVPPAAPSDSAETDIEPLESTTSDETSSVETEPEDSEAELPPNAYRAVVTWPDGLSLRAEPDTDAERIGGIESEASIIILEDSADGKWQRVRLENEQEGWIKGGNTEKTP
jgi:Bacterial SH3 domain